MESKDGEIQFPEIKSAVLEKVIQYMYYKVRWVDGGLVRLIHQPCSMVCSKALLFGALQVRFSRGNQPPPEFDIEPEVKFALCIINLLVAVVAS